MKLNPNLQHQLPHISNVSQDLWNKYDKIKVAKLVLVHRRMLSECYKYQIAQMHFRA